MFIYLMLLVTGDQAEQLHGLVTNVFATFGADIISLASSQIPLSNFDRWLLNKTFLVI